jgi:hypothetical protein
MSRLEPYGGRQRTTYPTKWRITCTEPPLIPTLSALLKILGATMRFHYLSLALLSWVLTGCVTAENVGTHSSSRLCEAYAAPMGGSFMDPAIKDELVRRGHADCTTPAAMAERRAAVAAGAQSLQNASQLLQMSRPIPYPAPPRPVNCTSNVYGNQVQTTCY